MGKANRALVLMTPATGCWRAALPVIGGVFVLSACASGVQPVDCASADWRAFGHEDGVTGRAPKHLGKRIDACMAEAPQDASLVEYRAGRATGLALYCTDERGFAVGRAGEPYNGVCPPETEPQFLAAYDDGHALYALEQAALDARRDYERATSELSQHRYNLSISHNRYDNPTLANEDREIARQDIEYHAREIERLETDLPDFKRAASEAEAALDRALNEDADAR